MKNLWLKGMLVASLVLLQACMMAGNYHTAKTLDPGVSSFGMTFSANRYMIDGVDSIVLPNIIPELTYHVGVIEDLEVGGRVALGSMALELDAKYRLLNTGKFHLAVAPAFSYASFVAIDGMRANLPIIASLDLNKTFGFTASTFLAFTNWSIIGDSLDDGLNSLSGDIMSYGVSFGPEVRGETFFIRPAVEYIRYQTKLGGSENNTWDPFNNVNFLVHFGWLFGLEKQQLNRMEDKLDRNFESINRKLDNN